MIPQLSDAESGMALAALARFTSETVRVRVLREIGPQLRPCGVSVALGVVRGLKSGVLRARALARLVSQLDIEALATCLELLDHLSTDFALLELLVALCDCFSDALTAQRARRAAQALMSVDEESAEVWLRDLAGHWPDEAWPDYLAATRRIGDEILRSRAFSAWLAAHGPIVEQTIVNDARMFRDPHARAVLLGHAAAGVGTVVDSALLAEALDAASKLLPGDEIRAWVQMATSAGTLVTPLRVRLIAAVDRRPIAVTTALYELAPLLDPASAAEAFSTWQSAAHAVPISDRVGLSVSALAPRLDSAGLCLLLRALPQLCSPRVASDLMWDLAPHLVDAETIADAFKVALSLPDTTYRVQALASLMGILDEASQPTGGHR